VTIHRLTESVPVPQILALIFKKWDMLPLLISNKNKLKPKDLALLRDISLAYQGKERILLLFSLPIYACGVSIENN
jgi:hypothetical protein